MVVSSHWAMTRHPAGRKNMKEEGFRGFHSSWRGRHGGVVEAYGPGELFTSGLTGSSRQEGKPLGINYSPGKHC